MCVNKKLKELYKSKWELLIKYSIDTNASYPLLIKVDDEYINADIKIMIVGQETDGWCGKLEDNDKSIEYLLSTYYNYLYKNKDKNRRPFWNRKNFKYFKEELTKKFFSNSVSFIWNNISKIGKTTRGEASDKIKSLEKKYFNVFEEELRILKPDIIIFTIGNREIQIEHKKNKLIKNKYIFEIKFKNYPNIISFSTYHPNARIKGGKKELKKEILNLIFQQYNILNKR